MDHKDIEIIRNRLSNYQSPVNTNIAWAAFNAKSNVYASKLFIIISLGLITVAALLGTFIWTIKEEGKEKDITNKSSLREATESSKTSTTTADVETIEIIQIIDSKQFKRECKIYMTAAIAPQKQARNTINLGETAASRHSNPSNFSEETPVSNSVTEINKTAKTIGYVPDTLVQSVHQSPPILDNIPSSALEDSDSSILLVDSALVSTHISINDTQQILLNPFYSPRHSLLLAYNIGVRELGGLSLNGTTSQSSQGGSTGTGWRPHGHQSLVFGYEYAIRPKIHLHGAVAYGLGYLNGEQGFSYSGSSGSGSETSITVKQQEWGVEIASIATLLKHKKLNTEAGIGASVRTFTLNYTAGPNTTVTGINGTLNPGETSTFKDQSIAALAMVRLNFQLPIDNLAFRLSGIYQIGGDYARHSFRGGLSYTF